MIYGYACPNNCGCLWINNNDGTMSLFGKNSRSCEICESLPLSKLIPLHNAREQLTLNDIRTKFLTKDEDICGYSFIEGFKKAEDWYFQ